MVNVLFIVLDAARRDRFAPYNPDIDFTPNTERLARNGTVYEQAVAQSSWTLPSHASIFTGLYPWEHGATQETLRLEHDGETLAEAFRKNGYATACFTANTWVSRHMGMTQGFDEETAFFPVTGRLPGPVQGLWNRLSESTKRRCIALMSSIREHLTMFFPGRGGGSFTPAIVERVKEVIDTEEDWFVFCNLLDAHEPIFPPERYVERHAPDVAPVDYAYAPNQYNRGEDVDWDAYGRLYDAAIDYLDDVVGDLLDHLAERGELEETIIVLTADHGEHLGEHDLAGHCVSVSEELVHVPLIIAGPHTEGGWVEEQVELRELYTHLQHAAGVEEGDHTPGTEYAKGGIAFPEVHKPLVADITERGLDARRRFVRTPSVKAERKEHRDGTVETRATDVETGAERDILEDLAERLDAIPAYTGKGGTLDDKDAEVKQRLADLGYR